MSEAEFCWPEDQDWLSILEPSLAPEGYSCGVVDEGITDPTVRADTALRLWGFLIQNIEAGAEGQQKAIAALRQAWRVTLPFTEEHKMLNELLDTFIRQDVPLGAEPCQVLKKALAEAKGVNIEEADTKPEPKRRKRAKARRRRQ